MLIMIYIVLINSVISVLLIVYLVLLYKGSIRDVDKNFVPKNLIDSDDSIPAEDKEMLHLRIKELYELEVADRDSARKREVEISKTKKFDLMFNLTGLTGLGAFLFIVYAIVYLDIPESNKEVWIHLIGICEGIVLSIFGYFFGSAIKNDK